MTTKQPETIRITSSQFTDDDFRPPSKYYIKDAMGDYLFVRTRQRGDAQKVIDEMYGVGKYKIRVDIKASVR